MNLFTRIFLAILKLALVVGVSGGLTDLTNSLNQGMGQLAFASFGRDYATRSPANTTMYKVIAGHVNSFFALAESEEKRLPKFVREEFDAFLRCGIHDYGFIRLKCADCPHELRRKADE